LEVVVLDLQLIHEEQRVGLVLIVFSLHHNVALFVIKE